MNYAFIKNNICINVGYFDATEDANAFKELMIKGEIIDDLVLLESDSSVGAGDSYINNAWIKVVPEVPIKELTIEERLTLTEDTINFLLGL